MAKGERGQKNTLILPRGPWLGLYSAANYCLSPGKVKSCLDLGAQQPACNTHTSGARGMTPVELSFTTQCHLCRSGKVTRHS